jgi:hypothetical protein
MRFAVRNAVIHALAPGAPPRPPPARAVDVAPYVGRYRASTQCHSCAEPNGPEFELAADGQGGLRVFGGAWRPLGGDLFVNPADGRTLAFVRGADGAVSAVSGGSWRVGERIRP